jgi:hypothetical protein
LPLKGGKKMGDNAEGTKVEGVGNTKATSWSDDLLEGLRRRFKPNRKRNKDLEQIAEGKDINE